MEFKSSFPWWLYPIVAVYQTAGITFYANGYSLPLTIFIIADLYVLSKFIFKTRYIMGPREFTAKRFLFPDVNIAYRDITEVEPVAVFGTHAFGRLNFNKTYANFVGIAYVENRGDGRRRKKFIAHPKDKEGFYRELSKHLENCYVKFAKDNIFAK